MDHSFVLKQIIKNVETVIIGKREAIELALMSLLCGGHVLIEDVPGVGKTSLAYSLAKSLSCSFRRIQFTPDIMPSDIIGFSVYNPKTQDFEYRKGAVFAQIVLADEINRTSPKTQSSLLEAMEEKQVTVDGVTYPLENPFMVLATQNPVEYMGTYPLPEAQLDRFFMRISIGYPALNEEIGMLNRFNTENPLEKLTPVVGPGEITELQKQVASVYADDKINAYIVGIVDKTRQNPAVSLGASPRASLNLHRAAQAWALYSGRDFVMPDDVIKMSRHVLSHRIILTQESRLKRVSAADIIAAAIAETPVPGM